MIASDANANNENRPKPRGVQPRESTTTTGERILTVRMPSTLHTRLSRASRGAKAKSLNAFAVEAIESAVVAVESEETTNAATGEPPASEND